MNIVIHDIQSNEYLSRMFLGCLAAYMRDTGHQVSVVRELDGVSGSVVLIHGDLLSPERILQIKENCNKLVSFDINDSSYFSSAYCGSTETDLIDLFFKVSGVPTKNTSQDISIDRNFAMYATDVEYLPTEQWTAFKAIKDAGRIKPLPYVLWNPLVARDYPMRPYSERSGRVLIRGGNHFLRFVLFLRLMQQGLDDNRSMFATRDYFKSSMIERFRYCQPCIDERMVKGKTCYDTVYDIQYCKSPAMWGTPGEFYGGPMFGRPSVHGQFNNRCPASFMWLAKEYERCRGPLNKDILERALSGSMESDSSFAKDLSSAAFAGDYKPLNTINFPPRFAEAASVGTVSFYADRVNDQEYWPPVQDKVHYWTYKTDMSEFIMPTEAEWTEVSKAAKALYEDHLRGTQYPVGTSMLKYMADSILEIA